MMRLSKRTRYALYAAMELARVGPPDSVTASEVARRYGVPPTVLAKVFQQLVRGKIAVGVRGSGGGYRLAANPAAITVLDVMEAIEPTREPGRCLLDDRPDDGCLRPAHCRLRQLFDEVDGLARNTFASVTLETLVRAPRPGTLRVLAGRSS